jgi:hypothetical protein
LAFPLITRSHYREAFVIASIASRTVLLKAACFSLKEIIATGTMNFGLTSRRADDEGRIDGLRSSWSLFLESWGLGAG